MDCMSFGQFIEALVESGLHVECYNDTIIVNKFLRMRYFTSCDKEQLITFRFENHYINYDLVQYVIESINDMDALTTTFSDHKINGILSYIRFNAAGKFYTIYFAMQYFIINGRKMSNVQDIINGVIGGML